MVNESNFSFSVHADAVLKATNVDGVYVCDSQNNNVVAEHISFRELVSGGDSPLDLMAVTLCEENAIPGPYFLSVLFTLPDTIL